MRYDIEFVRRKSVESLIKENVAESDAKIIVDSMLEADICGVSTHGIRMLPSYITKLRKGEFSLRDITIIKHTPTFTTVDANNAIGAVSASKCVSIATENAKQYGIHTVLARNCNTFGPAFYYVEKMSESGFIGVVCCNAPAAMPAFNGLEVMLGTNPFAFSCPSATQGSITLDMATSVVAKSRFETCRLNGEKLQPGWALDVDGNPTTDPVEAIKGFVLPMAGFKGYGIAMMIDVLSGALSGAAYLNKVGKFYSKDGKGMNVGQLFIAIDPNLVCENDFYDIMDDYIKRLRSSKCVNEKTIAIPGDDRIKKKTDSLSVGINLAENTVFKLSELFGCELREV